MKLSICLILLLLLGGCAGKEGVIYQVDREEGVAYVVGYTGSEKKVKIASEYKGFPVDGIYEYAFYDCSRLKSISIPDSVTSIGNYAFYGCSNLSSISIPDDVTRIGYYAFKGCSSLSSISIPDGVTSIDNGAFSGCNSLSSVVIPGSVTYIGENAFLDTPWLNERFYGQEFVIINNILYKYKGNEFNITIPDRVTCIGPGAFKGCKSINNIKISTDVTRIESYAFSGCSNLYQIVIPNNVTHIGYNVFSDCGKFVIICHEDSYAHTYGLNNKISCRLLH